MTQFFDLERPFFRRLATFGAVGCALLIAYLSLSPADGLPEVRWTDKISHFIAYAGFGAPLAVALGRSRWLTAVAFATAYGALMELAQGTLTAERTPDLFDAIANTLGACAGVGFACALLVLKR